MILHLVSIALTLNATPEPAANGQPAAATEAVVMTHRWGVEIDLIQPFLPTVNIIRPKLTRTLWGPTGGLRGDLIVGLYFRPNIEHDVLARISEHMGTVGYRQYFWRGLHLEAMISAGTAWGTNLFDGQFYRTPTLFADLNVGYRFAFFEPGGFFADRAGTVSFFATAQAGVLTTLGIKGLNDIGPRGGKPDIFPQGNLIVGASF